MVFTTAAVVRRGLYLGEGRMVREIGVGRMGWRVSIWCTTIRPAAVRAVGDSMRLILLIMSRDRHGRTKRYVYGGAFRAQTRDEGGLGQACYVPTVRAESHDHAC